MKEQLNYQNHLNQILLSHHSICHKVTDLFCISFTLSTDRIKSRFLVAKLEEQTDRNRRLLCETLHQLIRSNDSKTLLEFLCRTKMNLEDDISSSESGDNIIHSAVKSNDAGT